MPGPRLPHLDGIRGLAILAVVLAHILPDQLGPLGPLGVLAFFVLSGYLITSLLVAEVQTNGRVDLRAFLIRRAARLLPALVLVLSSVLLLTAFTSSVSELLRVATGSILGLLYLTDVALAVNADLPIELHPLWSLAVEEHFYLLWPIVVGFVAAARGAQTLKLLTARASLSLVLAGFVLAVIRTRTAVDLYFLPTSWLGTLLAGAFLALAVPGWRQQHRSTGRPPRAVAKAAATTAGVLLVATLAAAQPTMSPFTVMALIPALTITVTPLLARVLVVDTSRLRSVLSIRPLAVLGRVSYGVYLLNVPLIVGAERVLGTGLLVRAAAVLLAIGLAFPMFHLIELPVMRAVARRQRAAHSTAPSTVVATV